MLSFFLSFVAFLFFLSGVDLPVPRDDAGLRIRAKLTPGSVGGMGTEVRTRCGVSGAFVGDAGIRELHLGAYRIGAVLICAAREVAHRLPIAGGRRGVRLPAVLKVGLDLGE